MRTKPISLEDALYKYGRRFSRFDDEVDAVVAQINELIVERFDRHQHFGYVNLGSDMAGTLTGNGLSLEAAVSARFEKAGWGMLIISTNGDLLLYFDIDW